MRNNQLTKVKIILILMQTHRTDLESKYYDAIEDVLNGAQWNVRSYREWISFSKDTSNERLLI